MSGSAEVSVDTLQNEIDEQTTVFNQLKLSGGEGLAAVKTRLAELKKSLNLMKNSVSGGKDTGKKKERLLLKTAKVRELAIFPYTPSLTSL